MKVKVNRDAIVKLKGQVPVPESIKDIKLNDTQVKRLTEILIENSTKQESPSGLFFNKGEENETT